MAPTELVLGYSLPSTINSVNNLVLFDYSYIKGFSIKSSSSRQSILPSILISARFFSRLLFSSNFCRTGQPLTICSLSSVSSRLCEKSRVFRFMKMKNILQRGIFLCSLWLRFSSSYFGLKFAAFTIFSIILKL